MLAPPSEWRGASGSLRSGPRCWKNVLLCGADELIKCWSPPIRSKSVGGAAEPAGHLIIIGASNDTRKACGDLNHHRPPAAMNARRRREGKKRHTKENNAFVAGKFNHLRLSPSLSIFLPFSSTQTSLSIPKNLILIEVFTSKHTRTRVMCVI